MSNNPKCFIRKTCVEITFRTEEGLPLVAAPFIKAIVMSILARSQSLYPVTLCHFIGVREKERYFHETRKHSVIGAHALRLESMRKKYIPKKRGKRMSCLSSYKKRRVAFISWFKEQCEQARAWYLVWKAGSVRANPPPGMFAPGGVLASNLIPDFVPA